MEPSLARLVDAVGAAINAGPCRIVGGDSKGFLGNPVNAPVLTTREHSGILNYEPEELVMHVRAGTPLAEVKAALDERGQYLPFEPPGFDGDATIGGAVAAGVAGSRRPYAGGVRDYVLGAGLIDAECQYNSFGGQVMKNVAGYDVSRLLAGSFGMLGVIADVSLKVLPTPAAERSVSMALAVDDALALFARLKREGTPVSAAAWCDGRAYLRFSGASVVLDETIRGLNELQPAEQSAGFWDDLDNHRLDVLAGARELWRLSLPPGAECDMAFDVIDWGGGQRWLCDPKSNPRGAARSDCGHWTLYRGAPESGEPAFDRPAPPLMAIHERLKATFDPHGRFNPGRMYSGL